MKKKMLSSRLCSEFQGGWWIPPWKYEGKMSCTLRTGLKQEVQKAVKWC